MKNSNLDTDFRFPFDIISGYHQQLSLMLSIINSNCHQVDISSTHSIINSYYHLILLSNAINSYDQLMLSKPHIIGHSTLQAYTTTENAERAASPKLLSTSGGQLGTNMCAAGSFRKTPMTFPYHSGIVTHQPKKILIPDLGLYN